MIMQKDIVEDKPSNEEEQKGRLNIKSFNKASGEQYDIVNTVVDFLGKHTAYDALPRSGKVSVFNSNMPICLAFDCLRNQGLYVNQL